MTARAEWCGFGVRTGRLRLLDYHEFDQYRRAASYVETPRTSGREACRRPSAARTRYDLVINLKTASSGEHEEAQVLVRLLGKQTRLGVRTLRCRTKDQRSSSS
jgi:hypothetical protein